MLMTLPQQLLCPHLIRRHLIILSQLTHISLSNNLVETQDDLMISRLNMVYMMYTIMDSLVYYAILLQVILTCSSHILCNISLICSCPFSRRNGPVMPSLISNAESRCCCTLMTSRRILMLELSVSSTPLMTIHSITLTSPSTHSHLDLYV